MTEKNQWKKLVYSSDSNEPKGGMIGVKDLCLELKKAEQEASNQSRFSMIQTGKALAFKELREALE